MKQALSDKNKVFISENKKADEFSYLPDGTTASTKLNVIIGKRSSGKTYNLEHIYSSKDNRSENIKHAYENKLITRPTGTKNPRNKLSLEQVEFIKNNYKPRDKEFSAKALGEKFKVSPKTICAVFHGQNWGDKDDM